MKLEIKEIQSDDLPVLLSTLKFYEKRKIQFLHWARKDITEWFSDYCNSQKDQELEGFRSIVLVAFIDDRYLGFVAWDSELIDIFLLPKMRKKGYGLPLLLMAERKLLKMDKMMKVINAEIINKESASIFTKAGYIEHIADWYKIVR